MSTKNVFVDALEKTLSQNDWQKTNVFSIAMNKFSEKREVS